MALRKPRKGECEYHSLIKELYLCVRSFSQQQSLLRLSASPLARKAPKTLLKQPPIRWLLTPKPTWKLLVTPLTPLAKKLLKLAQKSKLLLKTLQSTPKLLWKAKPKQKLLPIN